MTTPQRRPLFDGSAQGGGFGNMILSPPAMRLLQVNQDSRAGLISPAEKSYFKKQILGACAKRSGMQRLLFTPSATPRASRPITHRCHVSTVLLLRVADGAARQDHQQQPSPRPGRIVQIFSQYGKSSKLHGSSGSGSRPSSVPATPVARRGSGGGSSGGGGSSSAYSSPAMQQRPFGAYATPASTGRSARRSASSRSSGRSSSSSSRSRSSAGGGRSASRSRYSSASDASGSSGSINMDAAEFFGAQAASSSGRLLLSPDSDGGLGSPVESPGPKGFAVGATLLRGAGLGLSPTNSMGSPSPAQWQRLGGGEQQTAETTDTYESPGAALGMSGGATLVGGVLRQARADVMMQQQCDDADNGGRASSSGCGNGGWGDADGASEVAAGQAAAAAPGARQIFCNYAGAARRASLSSSPAAAAASPFSRGLAVGVRATVMGETNAVAAMLRLKQDVQDNGGDESAYWECEGEEEEGGDVFGGDAHSPQTAFSDFVAGDGGGEGGGCASTGSSPGESPGMGAGMTLVGGVIRQARVDVAVALEQKEVPSPALQNRDRRVSQTTTDLFLKLNACQILGKPLSSMGGIAGGDQKVDSDAGAWFSEAGANEPNRNNAAVRLAPLKPLQAYLQSKQSGDGPRLALSPLNAGQQAARGAAWSDDESESSSSDSEGDSDASSEHEFRVSSNLDYGRGGSEDDDVSDSGRVAVPSADTFDNNTPCSHLLKPLGQKPTVAFEPPKSLPVPAFTNWPADESAPELDENGQEKQTFLDDNQVCFIVDGLGHTTAMPKLPVHEAMDVAAQAEEAVPLSIDVLDMSMERRPAFSPGAVFSPGHSSPTTNALISTEMDQPRDVVQLNDALTQRQTSQHIGAMVLHHDAAVDRAESEDGDGRDEDSSDEGSSSRSISSSSSSSSSSNESSSNDSESDDEEDSSDASAESDEMNPLAHGVAMMAHSSRSPQQQQQQQQQTVDYVREAAECAQESSSGDEELDVGKENCPPPAAARRPAPRQGRFVVKAASANAPAAEASAPLIATRPSRPSAAPPPRRGQSARPGAGSNAVPSRPRRRAKRASKSPAAKRSSPPTPAFFKAGDSVRIKDKFDKWYSARVIEGDMSTSFVVEYDGMWKGHREEGVMAERLQHVVAVDHDVASALANLKAKMRVSPGSGPKALRAQARQHISATRRQASPQMAEASLDASVDNAALDELDVSGSSSDGGVLDQMMNTGSGELSICGTHVSPLALPKQFSWAQDFAKTIVLKQTMGQTVKPDTEVTTNHDMGATTKPELLATVKLAPKLAEVWRCPVCTFANSHLFDKECTMCFYPREDTDVATMEPEQDDGIDAGEV